MTAHRFIDVFVCDSDRRPSVIGYVAACVCGWSGMKITSDFQTARRSWRGHEAARARWEPIEAERRNRETRARVAVAVLERVTNPCSRCQHMHMRDPVWACEGDCQTCNPDLPDLSYGPEAEARLRVEAALV